MEKIKILGKEGIFIERDDISVIKCGLKIPNDAIDYADFVKKIMINEQGFKKRLLTK